jgi:hypothetical protein
LVSYLQHNGSDDIDVNVVISNSERYMAWMFILHYRLNAVLFTSNAGYQCICMLRTRNITAVN